MKYFIGALLGINICLIWFTGMWMTETESRIRVLEYHQAGMEDSQAHTLARVEHATKDMVIEVKRVMGVK